jgi:hypothetical protein
MFDGKERQISKGTLVFPNQINAPFLMMKASMFQVGLPWAMGKSSFNKQHGG